MRISDARYSRDLRRYQLAWRLIRHGARARTVERWTALSVYRIHTLYEGYAVGGGDVPRTLPRGRAPHQVSFFWRSARLKCEAAVLGGFLNAFGALPSEPDGSAGEHLPGIARGERLCAAFEEFKAYWPTAECTLEHAILLLTELTRGIEIALGRCVSCHVLIVLDRLSVGPARCAFCVYEHQAGLPYAARAAVSADRAAPAEVEEGPTQGRLF
jgi:hypothetical protein